MLETMVQNVTVILMNKNRSFTATTIIVLSTIIVISVKFVVQ